MRMRNSFLKSGFVRASFALQTVLVLSLPTFAARTPAPRAPAVRSICELRFNAKGTDIQILIGHSKLKGKGVIECTDVNGKRESLPVKIKIGTPVLFPRFSFSPSLEVDGHAENIEVAAGGAKTLLGEYLTIDVTAAVGDGVRKTLDLQGDKNGVTINLKLANVEGFGLAVGATRVTIFR